MAREALKSVRMLKVDTRMFLRYGKLSRDEQMMMVFSHSGKSTEAYAPADLICLAATTPFADVQEQISIDAFPRKLNGGEGIGFCEPLLPCLRLNPNLNRTLKFTIDDLIRQVYTNVIFQEPVDSDTTFAYRFMWVDEGRRIFHQELGASIEGSWEKPKGSLRSYTRVIRWLRT